MAWDIVGFVVIYIFAVETKQVSQIRVSVVVRVTDRVVGPRRDGRCV